MEWLWEIGRIAKRNRDLDQEREAGITEKVRFESWLLKLFNLFDNIIIQNRAGRKTQVQPIRRGDSPPFLLGECFERIKYFCR